MRKIFGQSAAAEWQDLNPKSRSITMVFNQDNETLIFKDCLGYDLIYYKKISGKINYIESFINNALVAMLQEEFKEFFKKIQSKNFQALSYWKGTVEQNRHSQHCQIQLKTDDRESIELVYKKIGFEIKEVYSHFDRKNRIWTKTWTINPSMK